jgi:hypothetical protein
MCGDGHIRKSPRCDNDKGSFMLKLDYKNVPFRCMHCRDLHDHLNISCPFNKKTKGGTHLGMNQLEFGAKIL